MNARFLTKALAATSISVASLSAHAVFTITLDLTGVSASYQSYFTDAKTFWEGAITGYQPGISLTGVSISASTPLMDGVGGTLGSAGPDTAVNRGGFVFTKTGSMEFDSADVSNMVANGSFTAVIMHEMAHVLGFGTLWNANTVYVDGTGTYSGSAALAAYKTEFNAPTATFVPIELGGGGGTKDGHWNEIDNGAGLTGVVNSAGKDMRDELMTGWINSNTWVSNTTIASFRDLGYAVNLTAVPEPGALAFWLLGLPLLAGYAAKRQRSL